MIHSGSDYKLDSRCVIKGTVCLTDETPSRFYFRYYDKLYDDENHVGQPFSLTSFSVPFTSWMNPMNC